MKKNSILSMIGRTEENFRILSFIKSLSFFLIVTPFFILFKTHMVVTKKPYIISDIQTVMNYNIGVYYDGFDQDLLYSIFEPNEKDVRLNNLRSRFYNYINSPKSKSEECEYLFNTIEQNIKFSLIDRDS